MQNFSTALYLNRIVLFITAALSNLNLVAAYTGLRLMPVQYERITGLTPNTSAFTQLFSIHLFVCLLN
jgi:hypothetical protein